MKEKKLSFRVNNQEFQIAQELKKTESLTDIFREALFKRAKQKKLGLTPSK